MKSVMYAANDIRCGEYDLAVAGGMESMSNAPYALPQARGGYRMGNGKMIDLMIHDGLWDPYGDKHMGNCAEACVTKYSFTREEQDAYSLEWTRSRTAASRRRSPSSSTTARRASRSSWTTRSRSARRWTRCPS
jgi:acetyl-CoA C-acetyltransferase